MLGPMLASIHNLTFYQRLVTRLRGAIVAGEFTATRHELLGRLGVAAADDENA